MREYTFMFIEKKNQDGKLHYFPGCPFSKMIFELLETDTLSVKQQDVLIKHGVRAIFYFGEKNDE